VGNGEPNDNLDQDVDENGVDNGDPAENGISSGSLALNLEPSGEYTNSNKTLDFGFVAFTATIQLTKTVYLGDDNGAKCFTGATDDDLVVVTQAGEPVTYCFEVTNTSPNRDVWFTDIMIDDPNLDIDQLDMTGEWISNTTLLTPSGTNFYYYETTIDGDLTNTATAEGQPATADGDALIGLPDVTDTDFAEVDEVTPELTLEKTVYYLHDNGAFCLEPIAGELVSNIKAADVTYCLEITNTGDTHLDNFTLSDTLGVTLVDAIPGNGSTPPLAPGESLVYYY
jgi:hypothetical protein